MTKKRAGDTAPKDLKLKLRFRRILHAMGYFVPLEVELSQYYEDESGAKKRMPLTDLDVLGILYDELLTSKKVVGDCKSGQTESDIGRLFWLKGVADYFGATDAYLIKRSVNSHARAIAPKLGLRVLAAPELDLLEQRFRVESLIVPIADEGFAVKREELMQSRKGEDPVIKRIASYVRYGFWYYEQHRNVFQVIALFSDAAHLLKAGDPRHKLLAFVGLERFTQAVLELAQHILSRDATDVVRSARVYLYGGALSLRDREAFLGTLGKVTGVQEHLDPEYLPDLLDLVNRLFNAPKAARSVLQYIDVCYLWCVQAAHADLSAAYAHGFDKSALVAARDFCITFCKAAGLDEKLFEELLSQ